MRHTGGVNLLAPADLVVVVVNLAILALAVWALVDALTRPAAAFPAAGKLSKPIWLAILAVAVLVAFAGGGIFGLPGLAVAVAAIVYLVDVRPAVRALRPGGPWA